MKRLAMLMLLFAEPATADRGDGYGYMMDGYGYGIGMMFGPVLWLLVIGLIAAGVIWMVRRTDTTAPGGKTSSATEELDLRLARGEIDAEDYAARKRLLTS